MSKVLIAGGSGFIGTNLIRYFKEHNFEVVLLSRYPNKKSPVKTYFWSPKDNIIDKNAFNKVDIVINLSGAGIADKFWTQARKKIILESRIQSTKLLVDTINKLDNKPEKIISASAIGYYGHQPGKILTEVSLPGKGFLTEVCQQWEKEINKIQSGSTQIFIVRIGIVLSEKGGFFPKIKMASALPVSIIPGNGEQYMSWIHLNDLLSVFHFLLTEKCVPDVYAAVSPNPIKFIDFTEELNQNRLFKSVYLKIPRWLLNFFPGDFSSLFLDSQYILPANLLKQGYQFIFPEASKALGDILKKKRTR